MSQPIRSFWAYGELHQTGHVVLVSIYEIERLCKHSFQRVLSEIFKYLSYACHNASHLLLIQLCLILLKLRMGPIIGNVRELDHLSGTINHDFN